MDSRHELLQAKGKASGPESVQPTHMAFCQNSTISTGLLTPNPRYRSVAAMRADGAGPRIETTALAGLSYQSCVATRPNRRSPTTEGCIPDKHVHL